MNLTQISFKYARLVYAIIGVAMITGLIAYFTLPAREDPSVTIREARITTLYPNMPAERVELLITKTIEEQLRSMPELKEIRSVSTLGTSVIQVEALDKLFELDQVWDDVRDKVNAAIPSLPEGTHEPILTDDFGDVAAMTIALQASDGFDMRDMFDHAQHIRDVIYTVSGTKKVDMLGIQEERIYIETENTKLSQLGISPDQLLSLLQTQNILRPGGVIDANGQNFAIDPSGNFDTYHAMEDVFVTIPEREETIQLRDVATITRGFVDPPVRTAYFNQKPAIIFAVAMNDEINILEYTPRLKAQVEELNALLPAGFSLEIVTQQSIQVQNAVYGVTMNVLQTLMIVLAVVVMFLGVRTGLIVGAIVPSVMLVTLAVMSYSGISLERMSLATLVIALGLLVDNGIVVAEDFKRRLQDGESRDDALKNTGGTLAIPLLTSSLTTILVFLPLMLAEHIAGEYTRSISLVILISLMSSWFIALTVTPLLCYHFIKLGEKRQKQSLIREKISGFFDALGPLYERVLRRVMHRRRAFLSLMGVLFIMAIIGMVIVPKQFFPDSDREQVLVYIDLPAGTSMRKTDATLQDVFTVLADKKQFPHIENFAGYGGFGGPRFVLPLNPVDPEDSKAFVVINVNGADQMQPTIDALRVMFDAKFPSVMTRVTRMFLGPSDASKIEIQVKGSDADFLYETAQKMAEILRGIPGAIDVKTDWENRVTQLRVDVDQQRARRVGISSSDVAKALERYFSGVTVSEFREGDDIFPIIMRAKENERFNLSRLETVSIFSTSRNENIPLMQIADVKTENQFARIARENMFRTVTIEAKNTIMTAEDMVPIIAPLFDALEATFPPAHHIEYDGVIQQSIEAQVAMSASLPMCLGIVIVLLIGQFNSYRRALIICLTVPLMMIGASFGLHVMNSPFGFMVSLGLYALAGIIINNAIVLIDRIDADRQNMQDDYEAIITACVRRLRPIIMASVTTILGLLPLIIAADPLFYGLAVVIAFGLALGTVLTLGVTPVLYSLFFKIRVPQAGG